MTAWDPFASAPPTVKDGKYQLVRLLGGGGTAEVWLATGPDGAERAVKVLEPSRGRDPEQASRFVAEAKAMHAIRHPNVVRVHDVGKEQGWYWFAMDKAEGTLRQRLDAEERLMPDVALRVTFELLMALEAAHRLGLVHRDVKPSNLLFDASGRVVLADFGIARHGQGDVRHKTKTGEFFGSFGYIAPEQRDDARKAVPGSDLYAAGATLYEMLTGRRPSDLSMLDTSPELVDGVHPVLRDLLRRSCAWSPEERFANARAMAEAVAGARDALASERGERRTKDQWMAEFDRSFGAVTAPKRGCAAALPFVVLALLRLAVGTVTTG